MNIDEGNISKVLRGVNRHTKGYTFEDLSEKSQVKSYLNLKPGDSKSFGEKIIAFDNAPDNYVSTFNKIFFLSWGGNQKDTIEIEEPYTHMGRIIYRFSEDGIDKVKINFLYTDESNKDNKEPRGYVYDVYDALSDIFIMTYNSLKTIARDFGANEGYLGIMFKDKDKQDKLGKNLGIKILKRKI